MRPVLPGPATNAGTSGTSAKETEARELFKTIEVIKVIEVVVARESSDDLFMIGPFFIVLVFLDVPVDRLTFDVPGRHVSFSNGHSPFV